jgi:3-methylcrotonyl-CoA carboxylase beta subunit
MASRSRVLVRSLHRLPHNPSRVQSCLPVRSRQQDRGVATYTSPQQASQISILQTAVDKNSDGFKENAAALGELTKKIAQLHEKAAEGGSQKAREKHVQRGKMLVRDRVTALIDPGTSFLELSALAGHGVYEGEDVPAAGMVTGIGTVEGVMCMIVANDST